MPITVVPIVFTQSTGLDISISRLNTSKAYAPVIHSLELFPKWTKRTKFRFMAMTVNMHEAKTNFSKLAKLVEAGEEVRIARDGEVIMKLVKFVKELETPRDFSALHGLSTPVSDREWEAMDQEFLDSIDYRELDV